ncbi:hypothetical protein D3C81_2097010 [compost metagenome]
MPLDCRNQFPCLGASYNENDKDLADHGACSRAIGGYRRQPGSRLVRIWQTGEVRRLELGKRDAAHGRDAVRAGKRLRLQDR